MRACQKGKHNGNWKGGGGFVECRQCQKIFWVEYNRKLKARFCSMKCANAFQSLHPYTHFSPTGKRGERIPRILKPCKWCGKKMRMLACWKNKTLCSKACYRKFQSWRMSGKNNHAWKGGMPRNSYPYEFYLMREKIFERDGYQCSSPFCRTKSKDICVHHIDYNKANCAEDNLMTACPSCNARFNFWRGFWGPILSRYLRNRIKENAGNDLRGGVILNKNFQAKGWDIDVVNP